MNDFSAQKFTYLISCMLTHRIVYVVYLIVSFCVLNDTSLLNCFVGGFLMFTSISTANKKARLINGTTSSVQHQSSNGGGSASSSDEYQTYQAPYCSSSLSIRTATQPQSNQSRSNGPNLVNKQLVLPFVPPSFPNGTSDGSNHLIKPSEYLKSISDKRSSASSAR